MSPCLVVSIVVVFQIIVACDLNSKVRETGFCSVVRLFRISAPGMLPGLVVGLRFVVLETVAVLLHYCIAWSS